jgi:hypothetical protein
LNALAVLPARRKFIASCNVKAKALGLPPFIERCRVWLTTRSLMFCAAMMVKLSIAYAVKPITIT